MKRKAIFKWAPFGWVADHNHPWWVQILLFASDLCFMAIFVFAVLTLLGIDW